MNTTPDLSDAYSSLKVKYARLKDKLAMSNIDANNLRETNSKLLPYKGIDRTK